MCTCHEHKLKMHSHQQQYTFCKHIKKIYMNFKIAGVEKELKFKSGETRKQGPQGPSTT